MYKKFLFTLILSASLFIGLDAQRVAVVDINKVLETMTDYQKAQKTLDDQSALWRQEVNTEMDKVKSMYNKYQADLPMLNDEMKKKREDEITAQEQAVRDLQKRRFGTEGDLFKQREELIKPIQDKVYNAIDNYAAERGYDLILDKSSSSGILFVNANIDKTDDILKKIK